MPISRSAASIVVDRVAERGVRRQIEADGHRRELLLVRDHQRRGGVLEARERRRAAPARRRCRARRAATASSGSLWYSRHRLQDHAVLVGLRVDGRDLALAEGVVERVVDGLQRHAEPAGELAVDVDLQPQALVLRLGGDVAHDRRGLQPLRQPLRPQRRPPSASGAGQRVLVLRAADAGRDLDVLHRLEVHDHAGDAQRPARCSRSITVVTGVLAHVARAQRDGEPAGVRRGVDRRDADHRHDAGHLRVLADRRLDRRRAAAASR